MAEIDLDVFRQNSTREIRQLENGMRKLLDDLDKEVPTIRESLFVNRYLPHMANWKIPFPWAAWVNEISFMSANPVHVIDDNGNIVCTVPPLCDTDGLMLVKYTNETSINYQAAEAFSEAVRLQHIGQQVIYNKLGPYIPKGKPSTKWAGVWDSVLARYGYPTTVEVLAKLNKSKKTGASNVIDLPITDYYEDGELI
jgi:hypothetical protein